MTQRNSFTRRNLDAQFSNLIRHDCFGVMRSPLDLALLLEKIDSVKESSASRPSAIRNGSNVRLLDNQTDETFTVELCDSDASRPEQAKISILSPLGAALLGRKRGETATIELMRRKLRFTIIDVQ